MSKIELSHYGYTQHFMEQTNQYENDLIPARITAVSQNSYDIVCEHGFFPAKLKESFNAVSEDEFPTVGDFVLITYRENNDILIKHVLTRYASLTQIPSSKNQPTQLIGANIDYAFIVMSLNRDFNSASLEQYLTAIYQGGITPIIVLNKSDLSDDTEAYLYELEQVAFGVDMIICSVYDGSGMTDFEQYMQKGKTVVFIGSFGVGKSSLLTALTNKNNDSTSQSQLTLLSQGAMIIDTPDMRAFGLIMTETELDYAFSDISEFAEHCKFSDCSHGNEPGCAVRKAIEDGDLSLKRFNQYQKLLNSNQFDVDELPYVGKVQAIQKKNKNNAKSIRKMKNNQIQYD
jgi:ribosome biogenesis GTPase